MAYWIKLNYERNTYVIDLDRVTAFSYASNARVAFTLLDGSTTIVVTHQGDPASYQAILDYVEKRTGFSLP